MPVLPLLVYASYSWGVGGKNATGAPKGDHMENLLSEDITVGH